MAEQLIISIGREYGSGGRYIAEHLAKEFNIPLYDRNMLEEIAAEKGADADNLVKYDEAPKNRFLYRRVRGFSNSPEDNVANMQFEFLKKKADEGQSFVVLGRCAEHILRENKNMISIFVLGDQACKVERLMKKRNFTEKQAKDAMNRHDKNRKTYHNHYSVYSWGDSRGYDLCVNSSRLGLDGTIELIKQYVSDRIECK